MTLTATQLVERQRGIGGSDCAAALGLSPWLTPRELYEGKTAETPHTLDASSGPLLWGNLLEPLLRQRYADRMGCSVMVPDTIWHPRYTWMLAHLDGVSSVGRGWEGKTARSGEGWGEPGTDQIPQAYLLQVQHCMIVTGLEVFDVDVLIGGSEERSYVIEADRELQEMIVEGEAAFWSHVTRREPPPIDFAHDSALSLVKRLYPGTDGTTVTASDDLEMWRMVMEEAQEFAATYVRVAEGARAHLLAAMREASMLAFADGKSLVRKRVSRKGYTVEPSTYVDARIVRAKE